MPRHELIVDPALYDENKPIANIEEIRRFNTHRFEMEQLTGILYENFAEKTAVGYLDTSEKSFWVRGHMPDFPLMPGVIMCESAAQLTNFFANKYEFMPGCMIGLGGLESIRFRGIVRPGDRFIVQAKLVRCKKILIEAEFVGLVGRHLVCEGIVKGVPIANKET
ncbi:MAG: beta-hydroxyacyl-ACP dehydratase [Planctomycetaceae bacterium]|jgi:3-hydroxyacyl-[acyl-carrier-protein] dehydratase|nr:beta-hydroxyacyl-ACP dehydratase [Planctomycetaceae bacterium]